MLLIGLFTLALMLLAAPASAMPAVGAAVVAAVAAITWTQVIVAVVTAVVSIGLGYLASALLRPSAQKGAQPQAPKQMIDSKITIKQSTAPRQIIYGETRVGGVMVFSHSNNGNKYLHIIYAIAGHEVSSIDQVWINDEPHWTYESRARAPGDALILNADGFTTGGKTWAVGPAGVNGSFARFKFHYGTDTQTADETIRSNVTDGIYNDDIWGPNDRLQGIAYCYARFEFGPTGPLAPLFSDGLPNITFVVRGKKVLDPRTSVTAWSDNAALCVYDYLTDTRYGIGVDKTTGVDVNSVIAAANACDEQVTLDAGGTENRFTCNGSFKADEQPQAVLGRLLSSMHGRAPYDGEKWRLIAGVYQAATVSLSDSDLRAGPTVQTLISRRDRYNAVKGTYVSARDYWQETDFPPLKDATAITNDGAEVWHDIVLPFTNLSTMAQRLAKIELKRGRMEISATLPCKLTAWKAQVGDTIAVTCERYGWNAKTFEVRGSRLSVDGDNHLIGVDLDVAEINSSVYSWSSTEQQPDPQAPDVTPPDAFTVLPVTNLNATEEVYTTTDGTGVKSRLIVDWDASLDAFVSEYQVEYKLQAASTWTVLGRTAETIWTIPDIAKGNYNVRVAAVNRFGLFSTYVQISSVISGDTTPPEDVVGFTSVSGVSGYTTFSWTAPVNERARNGQAEIRYSTATSGATWAAASVVGVQSALNTTATLQTKVGTFLIKYKSANGVYSTNAASAVISTTAQPKVGIEIVDALPTTDLYNGRLVFLTTDGKLYRYVVGVGWTTAVPTTDLSGYLAAANFPTNLRPVEIVGVLPTTGNFEGRMVFLTTDGKLYRYTSGAWTSATAASDLTGQVTNAQIADMAAAKLTGSITTTQISDNAISTPKLASGSVVTSKLASGSITTEKLQIGDFTNYASNGNMALGAVNWGTGNVASYLTYVDGLPTGVTMTAGSGYEGSGYHIAVASGTAAFIAQNANRFPVTPGDMYLLRATVQRVSTPSQTLYVGVRFVNAAGTEVTVATGTQSLTWTSASSSSYSTQTIASDSILVPAGAVYGFAVIYTTGTLSGGSYRVGEVTVLKKAGGSLIVDGAIVASKLATNSVTADKVVAGAISTAALAANAITSEKLLIGDINNYAANPTMSLGASNWGTGNVASYLTYADGLPTDVTMTAGNGYAGSGYHIAVASGAAAFIAQNANRFAVTAGDMYLLRATVQRVSTPNQTLYVALRFVNAAGTEVTVTTGSQALTWTSASSTSYSTQTIASDSIVVPTGAVWAFAVIYTTGTLSGGSYRVGEVSVLKKAAGSLIVDGSIVASKLAANSVTTNSIEAGAITAAKIGVTQLSAISADMGTVTAGTITGATHQTASSGSVRAVMDTRIMFRCEDPNYASRTYYRNVGWGEPNIASHIGAEGGYSYSRLLNYGGTTALDVQSFGDNTTPANTPSSTGVYSRGQYKGVIGDGGYAGVEGYGATYDFLASGAGSNYGPFTGTHDALILKEDAADVGDIVVDVELVAQKSISNAITRVEKSSAAEQRGALGVVSSRAALHPNAPPPALASPRDPMLSYDVIAEEHEALADTHDRLTVNAVGEGLINVCGQGGDIAIGDLIVTSDTPGKGMRQADDIVRGYTVAKAREAATFATAGEVKTIACIYVSG